MMQADTPRDPRLVFFLPPPSWGTSGKQVEGTTTVVSDTPTFPRASPRLSVTGGGRKHLRAPHTYIQVPSIPREPAGGFLKAAEALAALALSVLSQPHDQLVFAEQLLCVRLCLDKAHSCQGSPMSHRGHFLPIVSYKYS